MREDAEKRWVHRDEVHRALGSPRIVPSMLNDIERAFEGIEESMHDRGMEYALNNSTEKLLLEVLDEYESSFETKVGEREGWKVALGRVLVNRREKNEIPF